MYAESDLMRDEAFRHKVWTPLELSLRQSATIDSYLQAAADIRRI